MHAKGIKCIVIFKERLNDRYHNEAHYRCYDTNGKSSYKVG